MVEENGHGMTDVFDSFRESIIGEAFTESPLSDRGVREAGYVFGGDSVSGTEQDARSYEPDAWTARASTLQAMRGIATMPFSDVVNIAPAGATFGRINDSYQHDAWTNKTDMPSPDRNDAEGHTKGDRGYAFGGFIEPTVTEIADNDEYDKTSDSWSAKTSMSPARGNHSSFTIVDKGYSVGGTIGHVVGRTYLDDTDEYTPSTDAWAVKSDMPDVRGQPGAVSLGGIGYAFGGREDNTTLTKTTFAFTVSSDSWATLAAMPDPERENFAAFTLKALGHAFVAGGSDPSTIDDVDRFDGASWVSVTALPTGSTSIDGATLN